MGCRSSVQVGQEVVGFFPFAACHCMSADKSLVCICGFLPPGFQESGALPGWNQVMGCHQIFYEEGCVSQNVRCVF